VRVDDALRLVGRTPLVRLREASVDTGALILGKLEARNPSGSVKDRAVAAMVAAAQAQGRLAPGGTLVVASAGNVALAVAVAAAARGDRALVVAPEGVAPEWRRLVTGLGAEIVLTAAADGMGGAARRAATEARARLGAVLLAPFTDEAAPLGGVALADELWMQTDGRVDRVVVGVGTGATAAGLARAFAGRGRAVAIVGVEPAEAPNLSGGRSRPHRIAGIGAGFVPPHWQAAGLREVMAVSAADAFAQCRRLATREGLLVGPSAGAVVAAARGVARPGEVVVAVLADGGERYLAQGGLVTDEASPTGVPDGRGADGS
jgi:cysteine synthase A